MALFIPSGSLRDAGGNEIAKVTGLHIDFGPAARFAERAAERPLQPLNVSFETTFVCEGILDAVRDGQADAVRRYKRAFIMALPEGGSDG